VLAPKVSESIRRQIDPESERRNRELPGIVEARVRKLNAERGQGGHMSIEISALLATEMRERIRRWADATVQVFRANRIASEYELRDQLALYARRDRDWILSMMREKYPWLTLQGEEIDFAMNNETQTQTAKAALPQGEQQNAVNVASYSQTGGITGAHVTVGEVHHHGPDATAKPTKRTPWGVIVAILAGVAAITAFAANTTAVLGWFGITWGG
jgi:hypothetical protein